MKTLATLALLTLHALAQTRDPAPLLGDYAWAMERDPGFTSRLVGFDMREGKGGDPACFGCLCYVVEVDTGLAGAFVTMTTVPGDAEDGYCVPDGAHGECVELWGCKLRETTVEVASTFPLSLSVWSPYCPCWTYLAPGSPDQASTVTVPLPAQVLGCGGPWRTLLLVYAGTAPVAELRMSCSPCATLEWVSGR